MKRVTYQQQYAYTGIGEDLLNSIIQQFNQSAEVEWLKKSGYQAKTHNSYNSKQDCFSFSMSFELTDNDFILFLLIFPEATMDLDLEAV